MEFELGRGFVWREVIELEEEDKDEDDEDPKTLPWPWNFPEDEDEKGLLTFFMNPLTLSFTSSISDQGR